MTQLLKEIQEVLSANGLPCLTNATAFDGEYCCLKKSVRKNYFAHYFHDEFLHAIVRKSTTPEQISSKYGIDCCFDAKFNASCGQYYKNHYLLRVPLGNGLINGRYSVAEKAAFFVDIARAR